LKLFWFIPTYGDGRHIGTAKGARATTLDYFKQVAQAADSLGYEGVLLPTGRSCEDAWITASFLASATRTLKFLVAVRPGLVSPTLAARMASSFDRHSWGRLLINVVAGGDLPELEADGLFLGHDDRYVLTDEFLSVWRRLLTGESFSYAGRYIQVKEATNFYPPFQSPYPPIYFGGSSPAGIEVAARHADVYLTWGEPLEQVEEKIRKVKERYAAAGRTARFGIRLHVIVRETEKEAWAAADDLIRYLDDKTIAKAQQIYARMDSHGQRRMTELHNGDRSKLVVAPNLWAGIGLVRGGAGTALVGSPEQIAQRIKEYAEIGIETFILSGYPHLEEAYRVAELLFPLLPVNASQTTPASGEFVAYHYKPAETR